MNRTLQILVVTFAMTILARAGFCIDACAAVDRYLDWRGGRAFTELQCIKETGTIEIAGLKGSSRLATRHDGYLHFEYDLGAFSGIEAVTPNGAWEKSLSGQVDEMGDAQTAGARRFIDQIFALSLQGKGAGEVSCSDPEEKEGKVFDIIHVIFDDGNYFDYFVTPETGALEWIRELRDNDISWIRFSDWKTVSDVRFAHNEEAFEENPAENSVQRWTTVVADADLPIENFEKPAASASLLHFTDGATSTGWIEFNFFKKRRIFIDALVNGHRSPIMLDSGAEATVVDSTFAKTIALEGTGELAATGVAGSATVTIATGVTIEIGNLRASDLTVVIIDLADIGKTIGHPLPVIFGEEVFNELIVDIDYPNKRLAFHRRENFSTKGLSSPVEIVSAQGGQKEINVSVNGLPPAAVGLDTGSGGTISFFKPWADANNILDGMTTSTTLGGGVGGFTVSLKGVVDSIKIGDTLLEDVPVTFFQADKGSFATSEIAGNMGAQIFRQFRTTFDFGNGLLYLTPDPDYFEPIFDRNRSGLQTVKKGDVLKVIHVNKHGPAEQAGWKEGERIVAVDGEPIDDGYWNNHYGWSMRAAGTEVKLQMKDGQIRTLVLKDYY